jgi:hypothetical protein
MTPDSSERDPLPDELVKHLRATRQAERDVFGALEPAVRDRPMRAGDWSPKDHQAHLTMWKTRQADRYQALREGREPVADDREDDEINAELHATRAGWSWDDVEQEADSVSERLETEVLTADPALLHANERLVGSTFGNGPFHALTHFGWLMQASIGADEERIDTFVDEEERLLGGDGLPQRDRALGLYNLACAHALAGRLDRARPLLSEAFGARPDLRDWAGKDSDLEALRGELTAL